MSSEHRIFFFMWFDMWSFKNKTKMAAQFRQLLKDPNRSLLGRIVFEDELGFANPPRRVHERVKALKNKLERLAPTPARVELLEHLRSLLDTFETIQGEDLYRRVTGTMEQSPPREQPSDADTSDLVFATTHQHISRMANEHFRDYPLNIHKEAVIVSMTTLASLLSFLSAEGKYNIADVHLPGTLYNVVLDCFDMEYSEFGNVFRMGVNDTDGRSITFVLESIMKVLGVCLPKYVGITFDLESAMWRVMRTIPEMAKQQTLPTDPIWPIYLQHGVVHLIWQLLHTSDARMFAQLDPKQLQLTNDLWARLRDRDTKVEEWMVLSGKGISTQQYPGCSDLKWGPLLEHVLRAGEGVTMRLVSLFCSLILSELNGEEHNVMAYIPYYVKHIVHHSPSQQWNVQVDDESLSLNTMMSPMATWVESSQASANSAASDDSVQSLGTQVKFAALHKNLLHALHAPQSGLRNEIQMEPTAEMTPGVTDRTLLAYDTPPVVDTMPTSPQKSFIEEIVTEDQLADERLPLVGQDNSTTVPDADADADTSAAAPIITTLAHSTVADTTLPARPLQTLQTLQPLSPIRLRPKTSVQYRKLPPIKNTREPWR